MFPSELAVTPITITFHSLQPVAPSGELGDGLRRMFETTFKRIDEVLEKEGVLHLFSVERLMKAASSNHPF